MRLRELINREIFRLKVKYAIAMRAISYTDRSSRLLLKAEAEKSFEQRNPLYAAQHGRRSSDTFSEVNMLAGEANRLFDQHHGKTRKDYLRTMRHVAKAKRMNCI